MKKENNSFSLVKLLKTIFKPKKSAKNGPRKRERWMYRNE